MQCSSLSFCPAAEEGGRCAGKSYAVRLLQAGSVVMADALSGEFPGILSLTVAYIHKAFRDAELFAVYLFRHAQWAPGLDGVEK